MERKIVLEIFVDKQNEKGPGAFEHILIVLHKIIEKIHSGFLKKGEYSRPNFSFEISKTGKSIRFFVIAEKKYENFLRNQIYAHYPNVEIIVVEDYLKNIPNNKILVAKVGLEKHYLYPIKTFQELQEKATMDTIDPYSSITASLSKISNNSLNMFQINFSPIPDELWKNDAIETISILEGHLPLFLKDLLIKKRFHSLKYIKYIFIPFVYLFKFFSFIIFRKEEEQTEHQEELTDLPEGIKSKLDHYGYGVNIKLASASEDNIQNKLNLKEIVSTLGVYSYSGNNGFVLENIYEDENTIIEFKNRVNYDDFILSTMELSGLVHLPTTYVKTPNINWVLSHNFEPPLNLPIFKGNEIEKLTPLGESNFRGEKIKFGIYPNDRRRHMYIIGKTGMGKSTLLENMIIDDIKKGRGVAVIDPHGDLADSIIGNIPKSRTNSTIIFDPSDVNFPIAFNMLDGVSKDQRSIVASGLVGIFKKIFGDSWGPRLEHTLRNTILALLEYPNTTMLSIPLMLTSDYYRQKVVNKISDLVVKKFWTNEYEKMAPNQKVETAGPILNKVGQFLSSSMLRNILGQPKNTFDVRWAMDNKKIVIVKLSKGTLGEDASALLGAMMVTKFQMDAMSRANILEKDRQDFYLYVDEFQNFATDSFANILSEARKYKLNLVMANQYIDQMTESVKGAVFGNVGTIVSFQVGYHDSMILKEVFGTETGTEDLTNLKKYTTYSKLLIDGMPSKVFSADTFGPYPIPQDVFDTRYKKILQVSREKYSSSRELVEEKIYKYLKDIETEELKLKKLIEKKKEDKEKKKRKEYEERKKQNENK